MQTVRFYFAHYLITFFQSIDRCVRSEFTKITEFSCKVSVASIAHSFKHVKSGKASGVDGLAAEHFLYADDYVNVYLSLLFNSFLCHGYLLLEFMKTAIVPIIKSKTGNSSDKNNYRPIYLFIY